MGKNINSVCGCLERRGRKRFLTIMKYFTYAMFFIVVPLAIVILLFFKSYMIYHAQIICTIPELEIFLKENNLIDIGMSMVSLAVSVWLGINILNFLDRKIIEELEVKLNELDDKSKNLDDIMKKSIEKIEKDYNKIKLLEAISRTKSKYEVSDYLYEYINSTSEEFIEELFQTMWSIELLYFECSKAYEEKRWSETEKYAKNGLNLIKQIDVSNTYLDIRKSDMLFYKNAVKLHNKKSKEFSKLEMLESISLYKKICTKMVNENVGMELIGHMYNTIGYSYDLIVQHNPKEAKSYCNDANENMKMAVENNPKGRYFRNLGLTYQRRKDFTSAMENYKKAIELDPKDVKAWNTVISLILREIDELIGFSIMVS